MKKIFMALCMLILLFIAACSTNKSHKPSENMPAVSETNSTAPKSGEGENIYFGTINTIVGNELEVAMAKLPEWAQKNEESGQEGGQSGSPGNPEEDEGTSGALSDIPEGGSRDAAALDDVDGQKVALASTIEYTGEKKSFILPAGIEIIDLTGGKAGVSDLKKMNVLKLVMDEKTNTVISCEILE